LTVNIRKPRPWKKHRMKRYWIASIIVLCALIIVNIFFIRRLYLPTEVNQSTPITPP
jgi:hypothetical protein